MEIPENAKTYELNSSIIWFDDDGILYSTVKPGKVRKLSKDEITMEMKKFKDIIGHKKICLVSDGNTNSRSPTKEERDHIASMINEIVKAMAIVSTSPATRMIANLFFGLKPPPYPAKMFSSEKEALEWIRQYNK